MLCNKTQKIYLKWYCCNRGVPMLELENICFDVCTDGKIKQILKNINLKINQKFVVITGPNGSGKSSLAKIIMGIEKPTSGKILLDGVDITDKTVDQRANMGISFAFQQPAKFKGITVGDLLQIASKQKLTFAQICDVLTKVGLCARDYIDRQVDGKLSGGELKRIEIATAIIAGNPLCIFDEPEAGIDLWSFSKLIDAFEELANQNACSIIISHQERILNIADRIILLADGSVVADGSREQVLPKLNILGTCPKIRG